MPLRLQKRSIELADKRTYPGQTGQTWRIKNHVSSITRIEKSKYLWSHANFAVILQIKKARELMEPHVVPNKC